VKVAEVHGVKALLKVNIAEISFFNCYKKNFGNYLEMASLGITFYVRIFF